jgi:hypothetical protein
MMSCRRTTTTFLLSIFLSIAVFFPARLAACDCPPLPSMSKTMTDEYDAIFYGKIDSVSACNTEGIATAFFSIAELYKGAVPKHVKVTFECNSDCMMSFAPGEEWIMYTKFLRFDVLKASLCEHSRKRFSDRSNDIYFITSQRSFEDEQKALNKILGQKSFKAEDDFNETHAELRPHNEQPSAMNKLWLLLVSLAAMLVVYYFANKRKKK